MIKVRLFDMAHLERIEPKSGVFNGKDAIRQKLVAMQDNEDCHIRTLFMGDEPVAIVGIAENWPGVGECWSFLSDDVRRAPLAFTKALIALLDLYGQSLSLHRVQMTVRASFIEGIKFAQTLGFRSEGLLRKYGPDQADYLMFARVK